VFATTNPEKFTAITEITSLSLPYSNLTILPESLGLLFTFLSFLPQFHPHCLRSSSFHSLNDLKLTPTGMFQVIQALVFNFSRGNLVLESLE